MTYAQDFWEDVHRRSFVPSLGRTGLYEYAGVLKLVGPFSLDLREARAVVDIGPGLGGFLGEVQDKARYAVEVSAVNRERLEANGVKAFAPGAVPELGCDLGTCLSVVQHCDDEQLEQLLLDAKQALRVGGKLYMNGVVEKQPRALPNDFKLRAGRFGRTSGTVAALGRDRGFELVAKCDVPLAGPLNTWVIQLLRTV